jgi:Alcohol dehydrogenase GroES-like domain
MGQNTVVKCVENNTLSLIDQPRPQISDGEILVKLNACGICGTDIAKVYDPYFKKPQQIGHELVATIVETKSKKFKVGQRVAIAHHAPDPNSHYTLRGSAPMDPAILIHVALQDSSAYQRSSSSKQSSPYPITFPIFVQSLWSRWPAASERSTAYPSKMAIPL